MMRKLLLMTAAVCCLAAPAIAGDLDDPGYRNHPGHEKFFQGLGLAPVRTGQPNPANDQLAARVAQYLVYDEQCDHSVPAMPDWLRLQVHKIKSAIPDDVGPAVDYMLKQFERGHTSACQAVGMMIAHQIQLGPKYPELILTDAQGRVIQTVPTQ
jgi:hypothetical protein